jgi:uncharacterized membrane protein YgcG
MFERYRKRRAIKQYIHKLGPILGRRFGRKPYYSPEEVRRGRCDTIAPTDYLCYAYAIYCSEPDFAQHHCQAGNQCNYYALRAEIADTHFSGDLSFDANTAMDIAAEFEVASGGWFSGDAGASGGSSDSGGSSCGGGCGGD